MLGLAVSTFLWPQHQRLYKFFCAFIADQLSIQRHDAAYLEIGAGAGLYALKALETLPFNNFAFVDISEQGLRMTKEMLHGSRTETKQIYSRSDFLEYEPNTLFDIITANEVIQATEDPLKFLLKCKCLIKNTGKVYISSPINSPVVDFVTAFASKREIDHVIGEAGFDIEKDVIIPYDGYTLEVCEKRRLPINVAYILKPKGSEL